MSCTKSDEKQNHSDPQLSKKVDTNQELSEDQIVTKLNKEILEILKKEDYANLSTYIHLDEGLRFSMYSFVSDEDKTFSKLDFDKYINSDIRFTFGEKDGLAEKYSVSLKDYFKNWVFKKDFSKAKFNIQNFEGRGNTINNIKEKYPSSVVVENYIKGTAEYSYMDWNSLILIFEKIEDQYYLVGIANNQWTI